MLKNVKQKNYHEPVPHVIKESFAHLWHTFRDVKKNKNIFLFCISYFFYIDCVNTVTKMAVSLATEMGITDTMSLVVVIFINIIAVSYTHLLIHGIDVAKSSSCKYYIFSMNKTKSKKFIG